MPVIAIGSVGVAAPFFARPDEDAQPSLTLAPLVGLLRRGEFDLIALGRAVLADPEWARKLAEARLGEIRPYDKWPARSSTERLVGRARLLLRICRRKEPCHDSAWFR